MPIRRPTLARVATLAVCALLVFPLGVSAHPGESERIKILSQRIEGEPKDPRHYLARGTLYSHTGIHALAMADLRKAETLSEPVFVAYELGLLHHRMGKLAEARTQLDLFIKRFPNHAPALEQRARLFADLGDTKAAVADYERLFAVTPRPNPGSYVAAARLLAAKGGEGIGLSLALLDRGMKRLGLIPQLQEYAIALELGIQRKDRALKRLEALEPTQGEGPEWKVQMAELLEQMERPKDARRYLTSASEQLAELRETPARRALTERISGVESALGGD